MMDPAKQGTAETLEGKYSKRTSLLDGFPLSLSALEWARRLSERASRVGFDWPNAEAVWEKIREELTELKKADRRGPREAIEEELGDLLFTLVNWARLKKISPEQALRKANRRFRRRFRQVELELHHQGKRLAQASLKEMDRIWNEVKRKERSRPLNSRQKSNRKAGS
jgi:MazG family protein